jgi:hypothetical protein
VLGGVATCNRSTIKIFRPGRMHQRFCVLPVRQIVGWSSHCRRAHGVSPDQSQRFRSPGRGSYRARPPAPKR